MKWTLEYFPKYTNEVRKKFIEEGEKWIEFRDNGNWACSVIKSLLVENQILKDKIKKLESTKK